MQPLFLKKKTKSYNCSFQIQHAVVPHMYDSWHYHHELELNLVLTGTGTRFVGDSVESFTGPDLVLVGPELPHVWRNDPMYYKNDPDVSVEVINFFFLPDFAGSSFFDLPELKSVKDLLNEAARGLKFYGETRSLVAEKMKAMVSLDEGRKLLELIEILYMLSGSHEKTTLASPGFVYAPKDKDMDKINMIYNHIINNFKNRIILEDVAAIANMNVTAFCRYFKTTTKKTLVQFVNEIRIGYACKLLLDDKLNITEICFECGFNNLSNFNRQFKNTTGYSPKEYKIKHVKMNAQ